MQFEEQDMKPFNDDEILQDLQDMEKLNLESIANRIKVINSQELANILQASTHTITTNHAGMLTNTISHPKFGKAITIQSFDDSALLIDNLF